MPPDNISLEIASPAGVFTGTFPKTTKIAEVIAAVVAEQGLEESDELELVYNGTVLQPDERTLVSFGLEEAAQLELVATGSGV